jgi:hypothetical protein
MAYVEPATVLAPRVRVSSVQVLHIHRTGEDESWAVARVTFDDEPRIGIRWNGEQNEPGIGNPQSRGQATWFIIPRELESAVLDKTEELSHAELLQKYTEMAEDKDREREAAEWTEGLIDDASTPR